MIKENKSIPNIVYECAKESVTIDFTSNFFAYYSLLLTPTLALKVFATSSALYTLSCTMGELGEQYYGSQGKVFARTVAGAIKYLGVTAVKSDDFIVLSQVIRDLNSGSLFENLFLLEKGLEVFQSLFVKALRGAINGGMYGAVSYTSSKTSMYSSVFIETLDAALDEYSFKSIFEGFLLGGFVTFLTYIHDNWWSQSIDVMYDAILNDFNNQSLVPEARFPTGSGDYYAIKNVGTRTFTVYYPVCNKWDRFKEQVNPLTTTTKVEHGASYIGNHDLSLQNNGLRSEFSLCANDGIEHFVNQTDDTMVVSDLYVLDQHVSVMGGV